MIPELISLGLLVGASLAMAKFAKSSHEPARGKVGNWLAAEGFNLISASPRVFWRGPFFMTSGGKKVFRVVAVDASGTQRRGWACYGWFFNSWKTGMKGDVLMKWDA